VVVHGVVVATGLAFLPFALSPAAVPPADGSPIPWLVGVLAARVRRTSGPSGSSGAELVRYWYGQMIRQGNRSGLPRRPGQTAREYQAAVRNQVTEATDALDSLTEAYIDARYSRQEVAMERGTAAQRQFRQVRQAMLGWLRRLRRGERTPGVPPSRR